MAFTKANRNRILLASLALNLLLGGFCFWLHRQIKQASVFQVAPGTYMFQRDRLYKHLKVNPGDVVFIGDSEILLFNLQELLPVENVVNRGILGDDTHGVDKRLPDVLRGRPAKLFIEVGANDFPRTADSALFYMDHIIQQTRKLSPGTRLYVQSLLPQKTPWAANIPPYNLKLSKLCEANQVTFIDLESKFITPAGTLNPAYDGGDGLHLNEKGYLLWADILKKYL